MIGVDPSQVHAIDTHVHIQVDESGRRPLPIHLLEAMDRYFGHTEPVTTIDQTADYYRTRGLAAVVFTVDATTNLGHRPNSIDDIVAGARRNADVLIPYGTVDPLHGTAAVEEARRQAHIGVQGFKFHPTVQGFDPSAPAHIPLFAALEELGLPIVIHTGQTGVGAGTPGGGGFRLGLSRPMLIDDVAARHPALRIVMAHPSVPWQEEALSIATHKSNVWIDLSGWSPKYFSAELIRATRSYLSHKMLFGSDYPALTPDRWLQDFAALGMTEDVQRKVLFSNAARLLGIPLT